MGVVAAILRSRLVREHAVVVHVIGEHSVAIWKRVLIRGRQQRVERDVHDIVTEPATIWPATRNVLVLERTEQHVAAEDAQACEMCFVIVAPGIRQAYARSGKIHLDQIRDEDSGEIRTTRRDLRMSADPAGTYLLVSPAQDFLRIC